MKHLLLCVLSGVLMAACDQPPASTLPRLAAAQSVTVSGVSSGAYMAGQFHVAYSSEVSGAALVAGGPWGCSGADVTRALGSCMTGEGLELTPLTQLARQMADDGLIDKPDNLRGDSVFVYHGAADLVVARSVSKAAADWYREISPDVSVREVNDVPSAHGWPTLASGAACGEFAAPFINSCDYDLAGELLQHLLGDLQTPVGGKTELRSFSQEEFAGDGLADEGYYFVPQACRGSSGCRIHVFFHGCGQSAGQIGSALAEQSGLLRWAESNDLIVLFPQATASQIAPVNPLACWDWWGYSGSGYLRQEAPQLRAVRAMVSRLQAAK